MKLSVTINSLKGALSFTDAESRTTVTVPARGSKSFVCEWEVWNRMSSIVDVNRDNDNCTYTVATYPASSAGSASQDTARINALRVDVSALQAFVTTPFDDYAARKAAIDFNERNLEKLYSQTDDGTLWRLVQITPCIKWAQVAGVRTTYENLTLYVDGAAGNDTTGDGSVEYPFKTLHCLEDFDNRLVKHTIKIIISAGTYTYFPENSYLPHARPGKIVLDASGETWPKYEGPFTVASVAGVGAVYPDCTSLATDLTVTAAGWDVDEFYKKSIHVLTGAQAGGIFPVFKNTTDTVRTSADWLGFAEGDTFEIVTEPVVIETATTTTITGSGPGVFLAPAFPFHEDNSLWMAGIRFVSDAGENPLELISIGAVLCACTFVDKYDGEDRSIAIRLHNSTANLTVGDSGLFLNPVFCVDSYVHPFVAIADDSGAEDQWVDIQANNSNVLHACCRRSIDIISGEYRYISEVMCSGIGIWGGAYTTLDFVYIEQIGFNQEAIVVYRGNVDIWSVHAEKCQRVLKVCPGSTAVADWLQANSTNMVENYAVVIGRAANLVVRTSDVNAVGQIGAINFRGSGTNQALYPVAETSYTDGSGAWATFETSMI